MKKILFILLLLIGGSAMGQIWQPADPTGIIYSEYNTGTIITMTPTTINIVTTPAYSSVVNPTYFVFTVYDSIGHFVEKINREYPNVPPEVCRKIYNYITTMNGTFIFTIYGRMQYHGTMSYSIEDYTYYTYYRQQEYIKALLR